MKKGFTLAEVLITLAIIGVIAALTIPSVIANTQQSEFKTGLKKAISVLNQAITIGTAENGETPYDNGNLFGYLAENMSVMKSVPDTTADDTLYAMSVAWSNAIFYTTDGMRFEFRNGFSDMGDNHNQGVGGKYLIYESEQVTGQSVYACTRSQTRNDDPWYGTISKPSDDGSTVVGYCDGCGSYGLANNPWETTKPPCLIMVDVNGDRKPNPANAACTGNSPDVETCKKQNKYKMADPEGKKLTDMFTIMITESRAIPWGTAAQKAMYSAQK